MWMSCASVFSTLAMMRESLPPGNRDSDEILPILPNVLRLYRMVHAHASFSMSQLTMRLRRSAQHGGAAATEAPRGGEEGGVEGV